MAKVTVTIDDIEGGNIHIHIESEPRTDRNNIDANTPAQLVGLLVIDHITDLAAQFNTQAMADMFGKKPPAIDASNN